MNKTQLVDAIAVEAGVSKATAKQVLDATLKVLADTLKTEEAVTLVGFGSFKVSERKERMGKNPQTGEALTIPAKKSVRFKPGSDLEIQ